MQRLKVGFLIVIAGVSVASSSASACYFGTPSSLLDGLLDAPILVVGQFRNAVAPNNALPNGQVELVVKDAVIPHAILKDRKTLVLPRRISWKGTYLVALEISDGKLDVTGACELDEKGEILKFVRGAIALKDKSQVGRLRYVTDWLGSSNDKIARSAELELGRAAYADFRKMAETLKPEPLAAALKDEKTPLFQIGVYARLLGHCGKKEHAALLRKLINAAQEKRDYRSIEGLMFGYVLLDKQAGWDFVVKSSIQTESASFLQQYGFFRSMRRLADERPDLVDSKKYTELIARFLGVPLMADFAVEDLRKRNRWEYCDAILDLHGKKGFESRIISNSVLRFALQCPTPAAKAFVTVERSKNAERVAEIEEWLAEEQKELVAPKK